MKSLIIVESPGKIKTIQKYLGDNYIVKASMGHIRNLPSKEMGIDILNNFKPLYLTVPARADTVKELKNAKKLCDEVILATDNDLEGEAIAWHIADILKLDISTNPRIIFQEITKNALLKALSKPTTIDMDKVNAQQARQVIDKLCGYSISPLLWKAIKSSLSAGRVQSMAARLTIEREKKIKEFESEGYFKITGNFISDNLKKNIDTQLSCNIDNKTIALEKLELFKTSVFEVEDKKKSKSNRKPSPPFITSTLQQEAGKRFGYSAKQTMSIAQKLYENGHITYHRTDSVNLSKEIIPEINKFIENKFGNEYVNNVEYKTKGKNAQEAHEAIRPTNIELDKKMTPEEKKLYTIIFNRTLASQMAPMEVEIATLIISISNCKEKFITKSEKILFPGFYAIYKPLQEEDDDGINDNNSYSLISKLKKKDKLSYKTIIAQEKFTKPIGRYTEPSLIKKLEELGIGRPSTYANIINKILEREYVKKESREGKKINISILDLTDNSINETNKEIKTECEKNKLFPTDIGFLVDSFLVENFGNILNYELTVSVEKDLDLIANKKNKWNKVVADFYNQLKPQLLKLENEKGLKQYNKKFLGKDNNGNDIYTLIAKYGPAVLLESTNKKLSKYASLKSDQSIDTISLDEALELLAFPKLLGELNGNDIVLDNGKFGPYIKYNNTNISIEDSIDITKFSYQDALPLINNSNINKTLGQINKDDVILKFGKYGAYLNYKGRNYSINSEQELTKIDIDYAKTIIQADGQNIIVKFNENAKILSGKYGPYFKLDKKNVPLPKGIDIEKLTLENCLELEKNYVKKSFKK